MHTSNLRHTYPITIWSHTNVKTATDLHFLCTRKAYLLHLPTSFLLEIYLCSCLFWYHFNHIKWQWVANTVSSFDILCSWTLKTQTFLSHTSLRQNFSRISLSSDNWYERDKNKTFSKRDNACSSLFLYIWHFSWTQLCSGLLTPERYQPGYLG